jgi:hypothetical protein
MGGGRYWPSTGFWCLVNECGVQVTDFSHGECVNPIQMSLSLPFTDGTGVGRTRSARRTANLTLKKRALR